MYGQNLLYKFPINIVCKYVCTVCMVDSRAFRAQGGGRIRVSELRDARRQGIHTYIHTYSTYIHTYNTQFNTYYIHIHTRSQKAQHLSWRLITSCRRYTFSERCVLLCMYVCMYVCMYEQYVCIYYMYVCMYVSMYVCDE